MRGDTIGWLLSSVLALLALALCAPLLAALAWGEPWQPFAATALPAGLLAAFGLRRWAAAEPALDPRAAFVVISASWALACGLGAIPYLLAGPVALAPVDAVFESVSGFTTTGATVYAQPETLPASLLLWRIGTQWLGGLGAILIGVGVLPVLGVGGMAFYKSESVGPTKDQVFGRATETARALGGLYLGLSALGVGLLWLLGLGGFDAVHYALGALSTGGFATRADSFARFDSGSVQVAMALLMLLGGTSFVLLRRALAGGLPWRGSLELRTYAAFFAGAVALIAFDLRVNGAAAHPTLREALQHALFQAASLISTSGYSIARFELWPALSHAVLFCLLFVGGMAGSSAGGVKVFRIVLNVRHGLSQFFTLVHPRGVGLLRVDGRPVEDGVLHSAAGFIALWTVLVIVGTLLFSIWDRDLASAISTSLALLGNVGVGFGAIAPGQHWADAPLGARLVACVWMLLGRLEIYCVLVLCSAGFWRR